MKHTADDFRLELALAARGDSNREKIVRMLKENGLTTVVNAAEPHVHWQSSFLAVFGIHSCSGCGFDPELYEANYGHPCGQCDGHGWMHEETIDKGVQEGGYNFSTKHRAGLFGHNPETHWKPKWLRLLTE